MTKFLIYLLLFGTILYLLSTWGKKQGAGTGTAREKSMKPGNWFRSKRHPREVWMQVYETATLDEARVLQARLEEQEIECIVYEQGKKDIHGNALKGIGIAVPKTTAPQAQNIISRMPV